jgi:hypothetical protein
MRSIRSVAWVVVSSFAVFGAGVIACSADDATRYGPPGGLRGSQLPSPTGTATGTTPPQSDGGGNPPPSDGGGGGGGDAVAQSCTVSFKTDIYPKMMPDGTWKCSNAQCHGGGTAPAIDGASASSAYAQLAKYTINGTPYFNAGNADPTKSTFECNVKGTCGAAQMPIPGGAVGATAVSGGDATTIDTWLKCGAPNN